MNLITAEQLSAEYFGQRLWKEMPEQLKYLEIEHRRQIQANALRYAACSASDASLLAEANQLDPQPQK